MEDLNPFDQFGKELGSALPEAGGPTSAAPAPLTAPPNFDFGAPPSPAQPRMPVMGKPQMNNMNGVQQPPPYGGMAPPYNAAPPAMPGYGTPGMGMGGSMTSSTNSMSMSGGAVFGNSGMSSFRGSLTEPPSQPMPGMDPMFGMNRSASVPTQPQTNPPLQQLDRSLSSSNALVPSATQSNPYASMLGPSVAPQPPGQGMPPSYPTSTQPVAQNPFPPGPPPPPTAAPASPFPPNPSAVPFAAPTPPQPQQTPFGAPPTPGNTFPPPPPGTLPPGAQDMFGDVTSAPPPQQPPTQPPPFAGNESFGQMFSQQPQQPPPSVNDSFRSSTTSLGGSFLQPTVPPQQLTPQTSEFDIFGGPTNVPSAIAPPAPAPPTEDPFGSVFSGQPATAPAPINPGALVVSNAVADDPFGIFGGAAPAPPPPPPAAAQTPNMTQNALVPAPPPSNAENDMWAEMGFDSPVQNAPAPVEPPVQVQEKETPPQQVEPVPEAAPNRKSGELPPGGEWYDARIFTPTLGVMFFKPQELTDSLFLQTDPAIVNALEERPVVAFIVEGSSARSAGVELGHVLLKVNGIDVKNPKEASRLIKEGPRPLPLLFYVPDTQVVVAEGEHMVKYDTRETGAPPSAKDWKPKYVVIGGIIAQPWMMNMYRSKSEYDIAVIETQARRPVSVKVKQFSLQGARIQNDWQGPQMVKYKNKLHPWKYIVILPVARNPIKISSPNLSQLKPVHEGIRRVLLAQQRGAGAAGPSAGPMRKDPYDRRNPSARSGNGNVHEGGVGSARRRQQNGQ